MRLQLECAAVSVVGPEVRSGGQAAWRRLQSLPPRFGSAGFASLSSLFSVWLAASSSSRGIRAYFDRIRSSIQRK
jgi:hypothetical protein